MRHNPWRDPCLDFSDLMSRLSRLKLSARLCNLGLNLDAVRPFKFTPLLLSLRHIHHGGEELVLCCAVSDSVWKIAPSPPWPGKSCRLYSGLESRTKSFSVARNIILIAPPPLRSENSIVSVSVLKVASSPRWSGKSRPLPLDLKNRAVSLRLESRTVSALFWKVAPYGP